MSSCTWNSTTTFLWMKQDASRKISKNGRQSSRIYFTKIPKQERYLKECLQKINSWRSALKKNSHVCSERTRFSVSWKSLVDGVSRQEKDLFHRRSWKRLYPLWLQVQETCLPSPQKIIMFRLKDTVTQIQKSPYMFAVM